MDYHGLPWYTMVYHGISWNNMAMKWAAMAWGWLVVGRHARLWHVCLIAGPTNGSVSELLSALATRSNRNRNAVNPQRQPLSWPCLGSPGGIQCTSTHPSLGGTLGHMKVIWATSGDIEVVILRRRHGRIQENITFDMFYSECV